VTASGSGVPDRAGAGAGAVRGTIAGIVVVLAVGLAFRGILAYLLPGSGFRQDLDAFRFWAGDLASNGLYGFYERPFFHDYTPGYLYVLWLVGIVGSWLGGIGDLIKVPAILADAALAFVVYRMLRSDLGVREERALLGAAIVLANPITWFDSVVWGQVDSVGVVFMLLAVRELWRGRTERSAVLAVVAALIKPQLGILAPLIAVVTIRRALWPVGEPVEGGTRWERETAGPLRIVSTGAAGLVTAVVLSLPFGLSVIEPAPAFPYLDSGLARQLVSTAAGYPYLTVNAYNPWALLSVEGNGLAANGAWVCDALVSPSLAASPDAPCLAVDPPPLVGTILGIPAVLVGSIGLLAVILATCAVVAARPDRRSILVGLAILSLAFFVVPTRVHERYLFPLFGIGAILAAVSVRWAIAYVAASAATFLNMYVVLTTIYPGNPGIADWLGIGPAIRSTGGVTLVALVHLGAFAWAMLQLRPAARAALAREVATAARPRERTVVEGAAGGGAPMEAPRPPAALPTAPAPAAGNGSTPSLVKPLVPAWYAPAGRSRGFVSSIASRMRARPWRTDRSRLLAFERGGRFDRLDVWLVIVLFVATLGLRTFRLAEPAQMHFDEVYHARTATEFLQYWRYGIPHDIYEWTHPHLAKYAIAGGLVAFARQDLATESDLGVPVRDATIEPRREGPSLTDRAGDRAWVATGSEVVAWDLGTRQRVGQWSIPGAGTVELDAAGPTLLVATDRGEVLTLDLSSLDATLPSRSAPADDPGIDPVPVAALGEPVLALAPVPGGSSVAVLLASGSVVVIDRASGQELGRQAVAGANDLVPAGLARAVLAAPAEVTDPAAVAAELAALIDDDPGRIEALLAGDAGDVGEGILLASELTDDERGAVETAIADGRLTGVRIGDVGRVAVTGAEGVTFLAPDAGVLATVPLEGGATGAAQITGIEDDPELYVATRDLATGGGAIALIRLDDNLGDGLSMLPMPGSVSDVLFDPVSELVHVVGATPDGSGSTVYVIEPNGDAVFADQRLPWEPAAVVLDTSPLYPAGDRGQLLAFSPDGAVASADVGGYPFAWRLPGVIAGALTALFLYLLSRVLFARRSVAILVGVFVLLDGMLFVQSRIAMNDVYVGLFILAAYTLFAWLWTRERAGRAFWTLMPVVGLLLGLALASKWVAAYAIGALGILILARSALGRVLLILGLVALTTVLGWLAIAVPEGEGIGNLTFMLVMIGLTLLAVVVNVLRPIAWTAEEVRVAVGAPLVAAVVVAAGSVQVTPLTLAFGLVALAAAVYGAFMVAARAGFGPLAAPDPGLAAVVGDPAPPPAAAWLRLGALGGLPVLWLLASLLAIPVAVYVASYIPWAYIGNNAIVTGWPDGHDGKTLLELTGEMYRYHDQLAAAHPASSPWWAWPLNLKPVWFYQGGFAADTAGAVYDAGNMVIWWLGIPAMAFVAVQAFRRRSLALALIAIGFASQWIPWARIDRAAFQYHYYTSLPFVILALAYFVAELWHGASARTWLVARAAAALAVMGAPILWLLRLPACAFVRVEAVNAGSQACVGNPGNLEVTPAALAMAVVAVGTVVAIAGEVVRLRRSGSRTEARDLVPLGVAAVIGSVLLAVASGIPGSTPVLSIPGLVPEAIALVVALPLGLVAIQVLTARDPRRFVVGLVLAAGVWFVLLYPNIAALPLPSRLVNAYQGILPTYLYPFQFPVSTVERGGTVSFTDPRLAILAAALVLAALIVGYAAWAWRIALAERAAEARAAAGGAGAAGAGDAGFASRGPG